MARHAFAVPYSARFAFREGGIGSSSKEMHAPAQGEKMKPYETPVLVAAGSFRKVTGLLGRHGNDRVVLSKN